MKKNALIAMVVSAALLLLVPQFLKNYGIYLLTYWLVFVIATMGLNLTVGYAGQKSLGQAAFFGIGAYTVAILLKTGISWWLGLPAAALLPSRQSAMPLLLASESATPQPHAPATTFSASVGH